MQSVQNYGLHWDGSVAWLLQGRGKGSNFVGLKGTCPFTASNAMCNHLVPVASPIPDRHHWQEFTRIMNDPLVRAMLPIPRSPGKNTFFLEDPHNDFGLFLICLSRLSSPILPVVKPAWTVKVKDLEKEMSSSNIQPMVVVQSTGKSQNVIDLIVQLAPHSPRTVIISGEPEVVASPEFQRVDTQIRKLINLEELLPLPLESIGAAILRRYSRREELDAPMEQRDDRRARQIQERRQN